MPIEEPAMEKKALGKPVQVSTNCSQETKQLKPNVSQYSDGGGGRGGGGRGRRRQQPVRQERRAAARERAPAPPANQRNQAPRGGGGSGKKGYHDASHLVNFRCETARDRHAERYSSSDWRLARAAAAHPPRSSGARPRQPAPAPRAAFLDSHGRFVVRADVATGAYGGCLADADRAPDWRHVELVLLEEEAAAPASCPICLYPPVAARVTRCGHTFCWPCLLHYLALSDNDSRRCPICEHHVRKDQLRRCRLVPGVPVRSGDTTAFRLMRREVGCLLPSPVDHEQTPPPPGVEEKVAFASITDSELKQRLSRLVLASPDQVLSGLLVPERAQLQAQLEELADAPEVCFVQEALGLLEEEEHLLQERAALAREGPGDEATVGEALVGESAGEIAVAPGVEAAALVESGGEVVAMVEEQMHGVKIEEPVGVEEGVMTTPTIEAVGADVSIAVEGDVTAVAFVIGESESITDLAATCVATSVSAPDLSALGVSSPDSESTSDPACATSPEEGSACDLVGACAAIPDSESALDLAGVVAVETEKVGADGVTESTDVIYFYQAEDGSAVFLDGLSCRMLVAEYGGFSRCPARLEVRLLQAQSVTVTPGWRQRQRALRHLPLHSQLTVCQAELAPPLLSLQTVERFRDQLRQRESRRREQRRRERRHQLSGQGQRGGRRHSSGSGGGGGMLRVSYSEDDSQPVEDDLRSLDSEPVSVVSAESGDLCRRSVLSEEDAVEAGVEGAVAAGVEDSQAQSDTTTAAAASTSPEAALASRPSFAALVRGAARVRPSPSSVAGASAASSRAWQAEAEAQAAEEEEAAMRHSSSWAAALASALEEADVTPARGSGVEGASRRRKGKKGRTLILSGGLNF